MNGDITEGRTGSLTCRAQRIERIGALLGEIEELSHRSNEVPLPLLIQTLETLEKARSVLTIYAQVAMRAVEDETDDDPQPDIDSDVLERMYRTLASGRRTPDR